MPGIRTFIALPTQSNAQQAIAEVQAKLKATQANVKWESQDKFHITLVFLGNVEQSKLELLSAALAKSIQQFPSCAVTYESIGAFPNIHSPRVVWIGTKANQTVLDLQTAIANVCAEFGFPKEDRVFHPHITLGRVKETRNFVRLTEAIKTITFEPIETRCSEILLMKSELRPGGSIYTILKSFPLHT
ncbi:MAG: RNA 2',3'-cyclic phosphodiesterase [Ignavibacteriales bacterium]|nr:RNA 2',3'-cyclic phosphodiesterase [Ignavibacteriales bacterium]